MKNFLRSTRPAHYFGFIFWTPFWLLPLSSEAGIKPHQVATTVIAGIVASALLEAAANMIGERRRYFYLIAGVIFWIGAAAFIAYAIVGRGMINALSLFDASQYTTPDARQFSYVSDVNDVPLWLIMLCAPFVALGFCWQQLGDPPNRRYATALLCICFLPIPFTVLHCAMRRNCRASLFLPQNIYPLRDFPPTASYLAITDTLALEAMLAQPPRTPPPVVTTPHGRRPLTLVVIVGESLNRNHMSLYGYCRPTIPHLDTANIFVFRDVVSMLPLTALAVPHALAIAENPQQDAPDGASSIAILDAAGFSTSWISNQLATYLGTGNVVMLSQKAQHRVFLNVVDRLQNYDIGDPRDEDVLAPFSHALAASAPRKAIFLHINGAHWPYAARSPLSFALPAAASNAGRTSPQTEVIADYDRTIRYDDALIGRIIAEIKQKGGDAALMMFSDHGEEVFDQIDWHGHIYPGVTRDMVEIPLIVWLSPSLRENRPELVRALQAAVGKRMQNTDISAAIADIADLTVAGLKPERRPLTAQFRSTPRRNVDGDYDVDPNFGVTPTLPPLCPAHRS